MLSLGLIQGEACRDQSRRAFLRVGTVGALGLTLGDLLALAPRPRGPSPPARAVIMLWLWGGPSHLDTFDMKPDAPARVPRAVRAGRDGGPRDARLRAVTRPGPPRRPVRAACGPCTTSRTTTASPGRSP